MTDTDDTPTDDEQGTGETQRTPRDDTKESNNSMDLDRRDYLRSIGVAGALGSMGSLGALSGATGSVAAQDDAWEADAEARIEEHRTGDLEVVVQNENGEPIPNAEVQIEMQEHDFGFGTAVHAEFLTNQSEWGDTIHTAEDQQQYQETIDELFNEIVLENLHKWHLWEDNTDHADNAVQWARDRGMDVRGHVCIWGNLDAYALPPRVVEAMGDPWASEWDEAGEPNRDIQMVRDEASSHIDEIINHYGDDIKEWEVVNEVLHVPSIIEAIEGEDVTPETAEILGDWYLQAQETASQYDCGVAINDYNIMAENNYSEPDRYEDQMDYLVNERGVDLSGIGMQCHFSLDERKSPDEILQMLDRYAEYGDLNTTEFDMFVNGWDEQQEADFLYQYLKTFFSHPASKDFLVWGHWTPLHWGDDYGDDSSPQNAPFFREDWSEKPGLDVYRDLVFNQWWNDESGPADADGTYTTNAFLGEHEITVTTDSDTATTTVSVTDSESTTTVEIDVTGEGGPERPDAPASVSVTGETESSVDLEWDAVGEAESYAVYVDGNSDQEVTSTSATVDGLSPATTYEFGVATVDNAGIESSLTTTSGTTGDPVYPEWDPNETYTEGDRVVWDGTVWEAQWWTEDQEPGTDEYGPWEEVEDADDGDDENEDDENGTDGEPQDTTGDGLYNDLDGSGSTTTSDVTEFFDGFTDDYSDPEYYDFDGNGEVTTSDVVELFDSL